MTNSALYTGYWTLLLLALRISDHGLSFLRTGTVLNRAICEVHQGRKTAYTQVRVVTPSSRLRHRL